MIVTDGVFSTGAEDTAVFHPAVHLDHDDYLAVQKKMRHRGLRWLHRHGHLDSAAVHTLNTPDHAGGWSVDASVTLPAWDRQGLERLVRYCARPALSQERLGRAGDDLLMYSLKRPTLDGRTNITHGTLTYDSGSNVTTRSCESGDVNSFGYEGVHGIGQHRVSWDARKYPSGVYFYRLETPDFSETKKMIMLK